MASSKGGVFTWRKERRFLVETQMSEKTFPRPGPRSNPLKQVRETPTEGRRGGVPGFVGYMGVAVSLQNSIFKTRK